VKTELQKIRNLIKTSENWPEVESGAVIRGRMDGPNPDKFYIYSYNRKHTIEIDTIIEKIWKKHPDIFNNFSKKSIEKEIMHLIRKKIECNEEISQKDWSNLRENLLKKKSVKHEIFRELKGCVLNSVKPIEINDIVFYNLKRHYSFLKKNNKEAFTHKYPSFFDIKTTNTIISIIITAKEYDRAYEIADEKFKRTENVLRYLFTQTSHEKSGFIKHDLGIFQFRDFELLESISISENRIGGISKTTGTYQILKLNKNLLNSKKNNSKTIWEILNKHNLTKIEKRVLNSIEWIGKAKYEHEIDKAFIQYFFAIESLINFNPQGIISPSVTNQMREYISFILGKNKIERLEIDRLFTKLYGIRSSIVHGSKNNISKYNIEDTKSLAERLVIKFLTDTTLKKIDEKDFSEFIKNEKYASC
tara:strand:+ start:3409 stop:4662 length:1254 start_codon:yes stop_codon:yes gene_type:complete